VPLYWDEEYQPTGTRAAGKTTSLFDSIKALITPPKIQMPSASSAPDYAPLVKNGNTWVDTAGGGGHWRAPDGLIWSDSANNWVEDPSAALAAVGRVGSRMTPTPTPAMAQSTALDQWMNTSNAGRVGSQFDQMGFTEAPTNRDLVDRYQGQQATADSLSSILKFAGTASRAATPWNQRTSGEYSLPGMDTSLNAMGNRPLNPIQQRVQSIGGDPYKEPNWQGRLGNVLTDKVESAVGMAGPAYNGYVKNFANVVAETGAQLTQPIFAPIARGLTRNLDAPQGDGSAGWRQFADSVRKSGGNPVDFRDEQNRKLAARPMAEQVLATTVYDPLNFAGAGLGAKVLGSGVKLGKVGHGIAMADKALGVAQAKAALPVIGGLAGFGASAMTGGDTQDNMIAAVIGAAGLTLAPKAAVKLGDVAKLIIHASEEPKLARALTEVMNRHGITTPAELIARANTDEVVRKETIALIQQYPREMPRVLAGQGSMGAGLPSNGWDVTPESIAFGRDELGTPPPGMRAIDPYDATRAPTDAPATYSVKPIETRQGQRYVVIEDATGRPAEMASYPDFRTEKMAQADADSLNQFEMQKRVQKTPDANWMSRTFDKVNDEAGVTRGMSAPDPNFPTGNADVSKPRLLWNALQDETGAAGLPSGDMGMGIPSVGGVARTLDSTYDIATSPADLVARAYGKIPGLKGAAAAPNELGIESIIGLRNSDEGLTTGERVVNWIREKSGGKVGGSILDDPRAQPIIHEMNRDDAIVKSQSNRVTAKATAVAETFDLDKNGLIRDTVLRQDQEDTLLALADELAQYRDAGNALGREIGIRPGIAETRTSLVGINPQGMDIRDLADQMGVYLPRGRPVEDGTEGIVKISAGGRRGGKAAAEKSAVYPSVATGIANGESYPSLPEAVQAYTSGVGRSLTEQHAANQVLRLTDGAGNQLAQTSADRIPATLRATHDALTKKVISLRQRVATAEKRLGVTSALHDELDTALTRITDNTPGQTRSLAKLGTATDQLDESAAKLRTEKYGRPSQEPVRLKMPVSDTDAARALGIEEAVAKLSELIPDDVERIRFLDSAIQASHRRLDVLAQRRTGKFKDLDVLGKELTSTEDEIKTLLPDWTDAKARAQGVPRDQGTIGLTALSPYSVPVEISNAFNRALKDAQPLSGVGSKLISVPELVNGILRGIRASVDVSFMGVQGLMGAFKDPAAYAKALEVVVRSIADPSAFGKYLAGLETRLPAGLSTQDIGRYVRTLGDDTEFTPRAMNAIPFFKQGNRAFSQFGDTLRYELFANASEITVKTGGKMDERFLEGLGKAVTRVTGTTDKRFGGDLGAIGMFAPRFFQSQLETVGKAMVDGTIEGEYARSAIIRTIGTGTLLTVGVNAALGNETDFDVNSPNFMRVRFGGQDISFFGPWDSLVRGMVKLSPVAGVGKDGVGWQSPDPFYLLRSKASPIAGLIWDQLSGKNFQGKDARPFESMEGFENFMRGFVPISVSEVGKGDGYGMIKTAVGATGLKSSPMTPNERRDEDVRKAELVISADGEPIKKATRYRELTGLQQQDWEANGGKIKSESKYSAAKDKIDEKRLADEGGAVSQFMPEGAPSDPKAFRDRVGEIQKEAAFKKKQALEDLSDFKGDKPTEPIAKALWEYYDSFSSSSSLSGATDFDAQQGKLADYKKSWTPDQAKAVEDRRKAEHVPGVQKLVDDKAKLGDSGFWDFYDNAWSTFQTKYSKMPPAQFDTYESWFTSETTKEYERRVSKGQPAKDARIDAMNTVASGDANQAFMALKDAEKVKWVKAHKADGLAALAVEWQYLTSKTDRAYINSTK